MVIALSLFCRRLGRNGGGGTISGIMNAFETTYSQCIHLGSSNAPGLNWKALGVAPSTLAIVTRLRGCSPGSNSMSLAGLNFLENWVDDNVVRSGIGELSVVEAKRLVKRCIAEAKKEGISSADMEAEVGDLTAFLAAALKASL